MPGLARGKPARGRRYQRIWGNPWKAPVIAPADSAGLRSYYVRVVHFLPEGTGPSRALSRLLRIGECPHQKRNVTPAVTRSVDDDSSVTSARWSALSVRARRGVSRYCAPK